MDIDPALVGLTVALAVGLLVGAERERRNRGRAARSGAGVRTFAVAALLGGVAQMAGGVPLVASVTVIVGLFSIAGYVRTPRDPDLGMTSELALVLIVIIGALASDRPLLAATVGVALAVLLAARTFLHRFVGRVLTANECRDGLAIFVATVIILPLLPDRSMGPFQALNPHAIWILVVMILLIGAVGHGASRLVGARWGLPVIGLISGFASSIATIAVMGARAKTTPIVAPAAVAGAVLSTVATIIQLAAVIGITDLETLRLVAQPLVAAGCAALLVGAIFTIGNLRRDRADMSGSSPAFDLRGALIFAAILSIVLVVSAALRARMGEGGLIVAAAVAGLADAHPAAISSATLAANGQISREDAVWPILAGLTTNTVVKIGVATVTGSRSFAYRVAPGLIAVLAAAWLGALLPRI